jgi:hypothetical protein
MEPQIKHCTDGSTLIEWIFKNARFGISIEAIIKDSTWFYCHKDGTNDCGGLPNDLLSYFKK